MNQSITSTMNMRTTRYMGRIRNVAVVNSFSVARLNLTASGRSQSSSLAPFAKHNLIMRVRTMKKTVRIPKSFSYWKSMPGTTRIHAALDDAASSTDDLVEYSNKTRSDDDIFAHSSDAGVAGRPTGLYGESRAVKLSAWPEANVQRKGCDVLVEALERQGVDQVFAYPGGASMEIHQALTRSTTIRNVLCRHEQGEVFAAEGYAKVSGRVGVCIATSGPGATNLVTGLADAMLDSVPMVAITGQVPRRMIGTDAFQETPITEISRQITKHNVIIMDPRDIPRIIAEAFFLASTGRPGPVLVDIPKDVQQAMVTPNWDFDMHLTNYCSRLAWAPHIGVIHRIIEALRASKKPVVYAGGGCVDAAPQLQKFVNLTGIPVVQTLMGLGSFPETNPLALQMLGMHGTVYANYAVDEADLLLAFGVRFDDRVTGKLESFASRATIVHIDIDPAEIGKNKEAHVPVMADIRAALDMVNDHIESSGLKFDFSDWVKNVEAKRREFPMVYENHDEVIVPQHAIKVLCEMTDGEAVVSTGVGQHQMWSAQWYKFDKPRRWVTSGGLGTMGFGLPSALGAAAYFDGKNGRPEALVVDIDGDGSFAMNIQELATLHAENIPVKIMILNNQHLGMVVQWEDRFYKKNRAHTYLGSPNNSYEETKIEDHIYPDYVAIAEGFRVPARRVIRASDLEDAIREMIESDGPFLLDVMVPHQEHVLPMIPGGGSYKDTINTGDGHSASYS